MNSYFYQGHLVRKCFGQNFLEDQFIIDSIISAIDPQKDQVMVEIGPGLAALTKPISKYLDHLFVIEIDQDLVARLRANQLLAHKLTIYQQDVMTVNFSDISRKIGKPLRIFGNLPYNIFAPLIFHLFNYIDNITDIFFMLQKEMFNRLFAQPANKYYGRLSVIVQYYFQLFPILEVPPGAFKPSPKVDSVMVKLLPHSIPPYHLEDFHTLSSVTMQAFNQRRKMIRNSLSRLFTVEELTEMDINPTMRAENISCAQYCQMANYIYLQSLNLNKNKNVNMKR